MKKIILNIETRVVIDGGIVITEYNITEEIASLKKYEVKPKIGWQALFFDGCSGQVKPDTLPGEYGEWVCDGQKYVWIPAV